MPAFLLAGACMDVRVRLCRAGELDAALARRYYALLDSADRERVDRLPPGRRAPMLLARGLLRIELARTLGTAPGAVLNEYAGRIMLAVLYLALCPARRAH